MTRTTRLSNFMMCVLEVFLFKIRAERRCHQYETESPEWPLAHPLLSFLSAHLRALGVQDEIRFDVRRDAPCLERGARPGGDRHEHARASIRGRAGRIRP